jgi:hypothetical protein
MRTRLLYLLLLVRAIAPSVTSAQQAARVRSAPDRGEDGGQETASASASARWNVSSELVRLEIVVRGLKTVSSDCPTVSEMIKV